MSEKSAGKFRHKHMENRKSQSIMTHKYDTEFICGEIFDVNKINKNWWIFGTIFEPDFKVLESMSVPMMRNWRKKRCKRL